VRYLFDRAAEAKRYYAKTHIYPINHCVVVRRSIVEQYPWVVLNIYNMFDAVKTYNARTLDLALEPYYDAGLLSSELGPQLQTDLLPYGVKRSRHVLETITQSVVDDGLAKRRVGLDEIFAPNTLDL
jgi:4,5-dihydroxyphthalate decarboxylase